MVHLYLYISIQVSRKKCSHFMSICCNMKRIHTRFFLKHILDKTVFWSNDLWIYYFSLKSNFKVNMDTLAVHLCQKYPSKFHPFCFSTFQNFLNQKWIRNKYFKFIRADQKMKICYAKIIEICNLLSNCTKQRYLNLFIKKLM